MNLYQDITDRGKTKKEKKRQIEKINTNIGHLNGVEPVKYCLEFQHSVRFSEFLLGFNITISNM